jgi:hypothetical protein
MWCAEDALKPQAIDNVTSTLHEMHELAVGTQASYVVDDSQRLLVRVEEWALTTLKVHVLSEVTHDGRGNLTITTFKQPPLLVLGKFTDGAWRALSHAKGETNNDNRVQQHLAQHPNGHLQWDHRRTHHKLHPAQMLHGTETVVRDVVRPTGESAVLKSVLQDQEQKDTGVLQVRAQREKNRQRALREYQRSQRMADELKARLLAKQQAREEERSRKAQYLQSTVVGVATHLAHVPAPPG